MARGSKTPATVEDVTTALIAYMVDQDITVIDISKAAAAEALIDQESGRPELTVSVSKSRQGITVTLNDRAATVEPDDDSDTADTEENVDAPTYAYAS